MPNYANLYQQNWLKKENTYTEVWRKADLSDLIDIFHNFSGEAVISFTTDLDLAIDLTFKKVTLRNSQNEEYLFITLLKGEGGRSRGWM